ncbi:hypothetical protein B0H19DRAFT_946410 [Mycena capillaripes]|nr:hypothetical protein B0H19DRAFT_946410 [Mycena capillaripes]
MHPYHQPCTLIQTTAFDLDALLKPFFGDSNQVARFRLMQTLTDTIISGSTALQYFTRVKWATSDLEVYVHRDAASLTANFLVATGYLYAPRPAQSTNLSSQLHAAVISSPAGYLGVGITDVLDFVMGNKKIQVIVTQLTPMEIILSFHCTCVMNIITAYNVFALYPCLTFIARAALIVDTAGNLQGAGRKKYVDRGWTMIRNPALSRKSELGVRLLR